MRKMSTVPKYRGKRSRPTIWHCEVRCSKLSNLAILKLLKPEAIHATDEDL